jgi:hypothetical protein
MGHNRKEYPHGTHVAKCPHGIKAIAFSSVKQRVQKFDGATSVDCSLPSVVEIVCLIISFSLRSPAFDSFDTD